MKNLLLIISSIFLFSACMNKEIKIKKPEVVEEKVIEEKETITYEYIETEAPKTQEVELFVNDGREFKIAIVFPSKVVGKYGNSTINSVIGYLLYKNSKFEIESFDSEDESIENITNTFEEIKNKGYNRVIALFTNNSLSIINNISQISGMQVYFPLIEKSDSAHETSPNFIYGSISYLKQMQELLKLSVDNNAQFYEESNIGYKLKAIYESLVPEIVVNQNIKIMNNNFKEIVTNERLKHTNLMINTPIVKSSIILSQLYAYEVENGAILSTQLNYNPLLISLTQYEDRLNLILANSIEDTDDILTETLILLDTDVKYNWVNYSSLVGINYIFSGNSDKLIKNEIVNSEVIYNPNLFYSTENSFKKLELN